MSTSIATQSKPLALQIHSLLVDLDPSRWKIEVEAAVRQRADQLRTALHAVTERAVSEPERQDPQLNAQLRAIAVLLDAIPSPELPGEQLRDGWQQLRTQLQTAYEALRKALRQHAVDVPTVRPTNYTRSIMHAGLAVMCIILAELIPPSKLWMLPLAVTVLFWSLEAMRHFSTRARAFLLTIFSRIAHPHERTRVNSSTWFVTGLTVLSLTLEPRLCAVAVAILGFADPAAGLVGRRFGKTKLLMQRSLEGSLAFVAMGVIAGTAVLTLFHGDMSWGARLFVAFGAALVGAIAELISQGPLDDNFAVPLGAGLGGWLSLLLLG